MPIVDEDGNTVYELKFYKTDENIKRIMQYRDEIDTINDEVTQENDYDVAKKHLRRYYDALFGEGTLDALYEHNPSVIILMEYFLIAIVNVLEDLDEVASAQQLEKYLK